MARTRLALPLRTCSYAPPHHDPPHSALCPKCLCLQYAPEHSPSLKPPPLGHRGEVLDLSGCRAVPGLLLSLGADGCVRLWDVAAGRCLAVVHTGDAVAAVGGVEGRRGVGRPRTEGVGTGRGEGTDMGGGKG